MTSPRKRDLVKQAIRLYSSFDGPDWEGAAAQVGVTLASLAWWKRQRDEWARLLAEVAQERLRDGFPIAVGRLVEAAKSDKSSSGVTAAKTLIDITRPEAVRPAATAEEESDARGPVKPEDFTEDERRTLCKALGRLRLPGEAPESQA